MVHADLPAAWIAGSSPAMTHEIAETALAAPRSSPAFDRPAEKVDHVVLPVELERERVIDHTSSFFTAVTKALPEALGRSPGS